MTADAAGFTKSEADVTLLTQQNLSVPITLKVGSASEAVTVTSEAPLVEHCGDPQSANAGDAVAIHAALGRSQFHLPRNPGAGRFRVGDHGWWNSRRWWDPRIRRGQLLDRNCGGCERQRARYSGKQVHYRWT